MKTWNSRDEFPFWLNAHLSSNEEQMNSQERGHDSAVGSPKKCVTVPHVDCELLQRDSGASFYFLLVL